MINRLELVFRFVIWLAATVTFIIPLLCWIIFNIDWIMDGLPWITKPIDKNAN